MFVTVYRSSIILVIVFLIVFSFNGLAQRSELDSLKEVIELNQSDTGVVKAYLHWGSNLYQTDIDSAVLLWNISKDFGVKARENVKRGSEEDIHLSKSMASALNNSAYLIAYRGDTSKAVKMHLQALTLSQGANDAGGIAFVYNNLGLLYSRFGQYYKALNYHQKTLGIRKQLNDMGGMAGSYNSIAVCYEKLGDAKKSFSIQSKALSIYEEIKDIDGIALVYSNMGVVYNQQGDLEKSRYYYQRSFDLRDSVDNKRGAMHSLANLGSAYLAEKKYEKAVELFNDCLDRLKELPEPGLKGNIYLNLGNVFENQHKLDSAKKYYFLSLDQHEAIMLNHGSIYSFINLASVHQQTGELVKARDFGEKGLRLAEEINHLDGKQKIAEQLSKVYKELGQWELASKTYELFVNTRDSLKRKENQRATIQQETQYAYHKKALKDSLEEARRGEINQLEIDKRDAKLAEGRILNIALIVGISLVVILVLVLVVSNRRKQKLNATLAKQKEEIEKQDGEKELLLKEIHHRVKNNLQIITGLLELQSIEIDDEAFTSAMLEGQNRVKSMALIHEKLYQVDELATIDMLSYIEQLSRELASAYSVKHSLKSNIECVNIQLDIDTAIPVGLILNELITNSWKYAFKERVEGELNVKILKTDDNTYKLTYSDDGPGLPDDLDLKSAKTLGMRLIKRLTQQLFGEINYIKASDSWHFEIEFHDNSYRDQIR